MGLKFSKLCIPDYSGDFDLSLCTAVQSGSMRITLRRRKQGNARAIAIKPRFLLFDEPTSALDPEMTSEVLDIIGELRDEGCDLLLVTHHMGFARTVGDHCLFVAEGKIVESGPTEHLFTDPQSRGLQQLLVRVVRY